MPTPSQLIIPAILLLLSLILFVLLEVNRSNYRRENEEMYGTEEFDKKVKERGFSPKEIRTLEKLVRASFLENKDAVLNSSLLFEIAVSAFYYTRDVFSVRDETLEAVARLREKMEYTAKNSLSTIHSTRQFDIGNRIDIFLENATKIKHSEILWKNEKEWAISYDHNKNSNLALIGKTAKIRWTRPEDAVYSTEVSVRSIRENAIILTHSSKLDKQQLRRWVREIVNFPLHAQLNDGRETTGILYDISAGGILLGLPLECKCGDHLTIHFELPRFGTQKVEIEILRSLGKKNEAHPDLFSQTASFSGSFGHIQERILQYIFEVHKEKKAQKEQKNRVTA